MLVMMLYVLYAYGPQIYPIVSPDLPYSVPAITLSVPRFTL
nr:MAG TPA: hypothetical protein [Caudoviricetes sp.]